MDETQQGAGDVSYAPSPPEEFCGRREERERLLSILARAGAHGQAVMISGPPGIGKSSLLTWLAYEVQDRPGGLQSPVLRGEVFDLPGMIFFAIRELQNDLRRHVVSARFGDLFGGEGIREAIRYADDVFEKYAAPVEPVGLLPKTGEEIIGIYARSPRVGYDRVRGAFMDLLRELGELTAGTGHIASVLLDDVHLASSLDRRLLRDILHDLPPGIFLAFTCGAGGAAGPGCAPVQEEEIRDLGVPEVALSGMRGHEIREMAKRRFDLSLGDEAVGLLAGTASSPFSLMACFNALRRRGLPPSTTNVRGVLAGAGDPATLVFALLPGSGREWVEELSVLNPPFPVPVMACMLGLPEASVTDRAGKSGILRRLPGGEYAFAHPLLQEHCRRTLPSGAKVALNARAADCFERSMPRLPDRLYVLLSLACHLFYAREYEKAADLNRELGLRFYHRGDYATALVLTKRTITSAEHLGDEALLAAAQEQRDLIRQKIPARTGPCGEGLSSFRRDD
ncbi:MULTISPECIES: AAA family ATPase [unclassified Methanoculleus]|jgi:hypothetical protein|uniref:ATP-binding protein n=2 Tax=Methanoculleus TaxID=45989 RepID=A0ABD8AAI5_9EURY|nr:ATP-binding protein [Methanoculleus sp. UBA377]WOX55601.1 ATP-binding protein [Methanoculleus palmolei]